MKLTQKSAEVFELLKANGGKASVPDMVEALQRNARSIGANVTDLQKKGLIVREYEEKGDKKITIAVLTEAGMTFVPSDDED